ncbi:hypothetical protein FOCC_FOCC010786 [Frankliniella occidentalis]|nr:hypothetical protein FOCC_FOCC010786 [Frankliniella occidentalis]
MNKCGLCRWLGLDKIPLTHGSDWILGPCRSKKKSSPWRIQVYIWPKD